MGGLGFGLPAVRNTYAERLNPDVPNDKGANVCRAPIDNGVVDDFDASCPAGVIAIVGIVCVVVAQGDGSDRKRAIRGC